VSSDEDLGEAPVTPGQWLALLAISIVVAAVALSGLAWWLLWS
jgi:hypothetical protein